MWTVKPYYWNLEDAEQLGEQLAQCLLEQGAGELLKALY